MLIGEIGLLYTLDADSDCEPGELQFVVNLLFFQFCHIRIHQICTIYVMMYLIFNNNFKCREKSTNYYNKDIC